MKNTYLIKKQAFFKLLDILRHHPTGLSLHALSTMSHYPKLTCYRTIDQLIANGIIKIETKGQASIFRLSSTYDHSHTVSAVKKKNFMFRYKRKIC